jgi:extradiol dioxygenase family protein
MTLSEYKVIAGLAVSDMDRGREFYEGKLGLLVGIDSDDNVAYRCAERSVLHVFTTRSAWRGPSSTLWQRTGVSPTLKMLSLTAAP